MFEGGDVGEGGAQRGLGFVEAGVGGVALAESEGKDVGWDELVVGGEVVNFGEGGEDFFFLAELGAGAVEFEGLLLELLHEAGGSVDETLVELGDLGGVLFE